MKEFRDRLKEAMRIRGINQSELCDLTKIPKSSLSLYISGAYKPKQERTYQIAKALRTTPEYLMGISDDIDDTHISIFFDSSIMDEKFGEDAKWQKLRKILQNMPEDSVDEVLSYAEYMKKKAEEK